MAPKPPALAPPRPWGQWIALLGVVALAAGLRLWGLEWGLPSPVHLFSYHPDEYHSLRGALAWHLAGNPNPHFFNYGSLYLYLVCLATQFVSALPAGDSLTAMAGMLRDWTLAARWVNVVCGLLTVVVVWRLAQRLAGPRFALVAAVALAVMPFHVLHCMYATVDAPLTLFVALTLLFAVRIAQRPVARDYLLAGLCAGLAASTKYSGAMVMVAPLLAHFLASREPEEAPAGPPRVPLGSYLPVAMVGVMVLAFLATSPYTVLDWPNAQRDIRYEMDHMRVGEEPARTADPNGWLFHLRALTMTTTGGALVAVLGLVGLWRRNLWRPAAGLVVFGALWLLVAGAAGVRYGRYDLPLAPLLALLVAAAPLAFWKGRPGWRLVGLLLPALVLGTSLTVSQQLTTALHGTPDPRDLARDEIIRKVPPDRAVGMVWEPWFQSAPLDPCNGGQVLRRNPLWKQFSSPLRPLAIVGLEASKLGQERPLAVVTSNFEVRDWLRVQHPGAQAFLERLHRDYVLQAVEQRRAPLDGVLGWQAPQDWLYAFPRVEVYYARPPD